MKVTVNGVEQKEYKYLVNVAGINMICCDKPDVTKQQHVFSTADSRVDMGSDMPVSDSGHKVEVKQASFDSPHKILI